jgi:hypothetical protein
MSTFVVPPLEDDGNWPSLGSQVVDWQESMLTFGPGDLLGKPYRLDAEDRALLERAYQVYPPQHPGVCRFDVDPADTAGSAWRCSAGNGKCGRRRFDTVVVMTRKGTLKSERLAATCAAELSEDGPVRCDGFRRSGKRWLPVGRPVTSPSVFLFAFAKEQAEDTSWDAMRKMIELGPASAQFDVWEERIVRRDGSGEAKALATAPDSRDGGKTTFQGKEEPHRWTLPRHKEAHQTTRGNLSKRPIAEPWEMHATTMYAPGEGSVLEELHDAAKKLTGEAAHASRMFFFYRWADARIRIRNEDDSFNLAGLREAIIDATGPSKMAWADPDGIASLQFLSADADPDYAERVWLNRAKQRTEIAFDAEAWKRNRRWVTDPDTGLAVIDVETGQRIPYRIPKGALVVLGFDGSRGSVDPHRSPDHTGLVATEILTGFQQQFGHWDPADYPDRHIPRDLVDVAMTDAFTDFNVWRLYADPPDWDSEIAAWVGRWGKERVVEWFTYRERPIGYATSNYAKAIVSGECTNDGDPAFTAHIGHAHKRFVNARDDRNERLWTIQKEREGSQLKIDLAMAGNLSWEARTDAIAAGVLSGEPEAEPWVMVR